MRTLQKHNARHHYLDAALKVLQPTELLHGDLGGCAANVGNLPVNPLLDMRVASEQVQHPGDARSRRVVPLEHERVHLNGGIL